MTSSYLLIFSQINALSSVLVCCLQISFFSSLAKNSLLRFSALSRLTSFWSISSWFWLSPALLPAASVSCLHRPSCSSRKPISSSILWAMAASSLYCTFKEQYFLLYFMALSVSVSFLLSLGLFRMMFSYQCDLQPRLLSLNVIAGSYFTGLFGSTSRPWRRLRRWLICLRSRTVSRLLAFRLHSMEDSCDSFWVIYRDNEGLSSWDQWSSCRRISLLKACRRQSVQN